MKVWFRTPSLKGKLWARTSLKRKINNSVGFKMPRWFWFLRNAKKSLYNKFYNKTSFNFSNIIWKKGWIWCWSLIVWIIILYALVSELWTIWVIFVIAVLLLIFLYNTKD